MEKVGVLLSTYNGEKYLSQQIESVREQIGVKIYILVRDDGSSDKTKQMLAIWQDEGILTWYDGENLKPAKSFLNLMKNAPDADYYAFCDQDDVWDKDKLQVAVNKIKNVDQYRPSLYFSKAQLVDKDLNPIKSNGYPQKSYTFGGSLIRNNVTGCTVVFNRTLLKLANLYETHFVMMHDQWIYSLNMAFDGYVIFDKISHIKYRQHDSNVLGGGIKIKQKLHMNAIVSKGNVRQRQAIELFKGYADIMPKDNRILLEQILNYKNSFKNKMLLAFNRRLRTHTKYDILFIISTIMEKY